MFTEKDIKKVSDIKEEGVYWIADTTSSEAEWVTCKVTADTTDGDDVPIWEFCYNENDGFLEDIEDHHVLLGPIHVPTVPIPSTRIGVVPYQAVPILTQVKKVVDLAVPILQKVLD